MCWRHSSMFAAIHLPTAVHTTVDIATCCACTPTASAHKQKLRLKARHDAACNDAKSSCKIKSAAEGSCLSCCAVRDTQAWHVSGTAAQAASLTSCSTCANTAQLIACCSSLANCSAYNSRHRTCCACSPTPSAHRQQCFTARRDAACNEAAFHAVIQPQRAAA
jgi:hypothetical protein